MPELAPEIVTRLMRAEPLPANRPPSRSDPADIVGIGIALAALVLAIGLALAEIAADAAGPASLPPLTPLAEGHDWNGFSA